MRILTDTPGGRGSLSKLFVAATLGVALLAALACGGGGGAAAGTSATVKLSEFKFEPAQLSATAGQPVKVTLQNSGTVVHDFTVKGLDKATSPKVAAGQTSTFEFTPSKAGTYEIVCTEPGHEQGGMKGTLTVK